MSLSLFTLRLKKLAIAVFTPRFRAALLRERVVAGSEHWPLLRRPWNTVVDIGANRGQFTLAAREWTKARIIAFEPLEEPAAVFNRALCGDASVVLHRCAIGPIPEERLMHVAGRDDSSSLLEIGAAQVELFPETAEAAQQRVKVMPLDAIIPQVEVVAPALLKIDVQGFEYEALLGCKRLLHTFDCVYCECSFIELYVGQKLAHEVIELLRASGFALSGVHNPSYGSAGQCVQADLLFERRGV